MKNRRTFRHEEKFINKNNNNHLGEPTGFGGFNLLISFSKFDITVNHYHDSFSKRIK